MRNYTRERYSTKEEWLKNRGFGGSSASAILGLNPYMSPLELYKAIVMPSNKQFEKTQNEAMAYGNQCEPLIRKQFAIDFAETLTVRAPRGNEMYRRKDKRYMTATLDGLLFNKLTKEKGVLEIKTHDIRNRKDEENWSNHIPDNYYIQVLHYLLVMNDCTFAILTAKLRFFDYYSESGKKLLKTETRYYFINRNDEQIQKDLAFLENAETKFWEENILKKIIPPITLSF